MVAGVTSALACVAWAVAWALAMVGSGALAGAWGGGSKVVVVGNEPLRIRIGPIPTTAARMIAAATSRQGCRSRESRIVFSRACQPSAQFGQHCAVFEIVLR